MRRLPESYHLDSGKHARARSAVATLRARLVNHVIHRDSYNHMTDCARDHGGKGIVHQDMLGPGDSVYWIACEDEDDAEALEQAWLLWVSTGQTW